MINELKGLGTALITPFKENNEIDEKALQQLVKRQIQNGVDYLVVLGTTAENATLTKTEKRQVQDIINNTLASYSKTTFPLVLGLGGNNTQNVIEDIKENELYIKTHYKAILSVCPYYNKPSQEGLYQHFASIAATSPVPVILYNVPSRTGVTLLPNTIKRLCETFPNQIIGIKEAGGDLSVFKTLLQTRNNPNFPPFLIICGDDILSADVMTMGGDGLISVASNAWPNDFFKIVHNKDKKLLNQYKNAINLLFKEGNPVGIKTVLAKMGLIKNILRLPLVKGSEELSKMWDQTITTMENNIKNLNNCF